MVINMPLVFKLIVAVVLTVYLCGAVEYYVTPSLPPNPACPSGHPCHTLQQYAQNASRLFVGKGNISLLFLNGTHYLKNQKISFYRLDFLLVGAAKFLPSISSWSSVIVRMAKKKFHFKIQNVSNLRVENVAFETLGSHNENSVFSIGDIHTLQLHHVYFKDCPLMISYSCSFINSFTDSTVDLEHCQMTGSSVSVRLIPHKVVFGDRGITVNVNISDCVIVQVLGNGLTLFAHTGLSTVNVNIQRTVLAQNENGLLLDAPSKESMKVNVRHCVISNNKNTGLLVKGGNVNIFHVDVHNCTFSSNHNGAMFVQIGNKCSCSHVVLQTCTVERNFLTSSANRETGLKMSAAGISLWSEQRLTSVTINNVTFKENHDHSSHPVILQLLNSERTTIIDSVFVGNHGASIQAHFSKVTFSGTLLFKGNDAFRGAGLSLLHSVVVIKNNTKIDFISNKAEHVGGAIFIHELPHTFKIESNDQCFYQLSEVKVMTDLLSMRSSVNFYNNTSENGGQDIYGAALNDRCLISTGSRLKSSAATRLFHFHTSFRSSLSSIASDAKRVCLCDPSGAPQCTKISFIFLNQARYPGEKFNLSLVLVGDEYGTVSGTVYATLLKTEDTAHSLSTEQQSQEVIFKKCKEVEYSIHSTTGIETLVLTAQKVIVEVYGNIHKMNSYIENVNNPGSAVRLLSTPVYVNITLEDCPPGFQLANDSLSCQCSDTLTELGIKKCEIFNHVGYIHRSGTFWIMASFRGNVSNGVVIHHSCPYQYCTQENVPVDPRHPDTQCALNHSGIICGGCLSNLSLAIGSNRCLACSNNSHVSVFVFFVAAGLLLVIFIKVLDLTVTKGTINGFIFYANIVWVYQSILFPTQYNDSPSLTFLKGFLAWINLDFGIEVCFIQGLNAYWKVWLQFVFPIYVWLIVGFVMVAAHYFRVVAKISGNNSVPVLATLFLLSYAKLVRNCITVLGFVSLQYPDHMYLVWDFDGNLPYFGLEHSLLFVAALMALLFLWLPYVSTLLFVPWLRKVSHFKIFCWISRWKPFYDAYFGPFKDKCHSWVGFLLIVRGFLLVIFSVTSATSPNINILIMTLTPAVLLLVTSFVGNVYKNKHVSCLETIFYVNMIFLGSGILCVKTYNGSKEVIVLISLWFAFFQFIYIIVFHLCCLLRKHCSNALFLRCLNINKASKKVNQYRQFYLRESLLEESDNLGL